MGMLADASDGGEYAVTVSAGIAGDESEAEDTRRLLLGSITPVFNELLQHHADPTLRRPNRGSTIPGLNIAIFVSQPSKISLPSPPPGRHGEDALTNAPRERQGKQPRTSATPGPASTASRETLWINLYNLQNL